MSTRQSSAEVAGTATVDHSAPVGKKSNQAGGKYSYVHCVCIFVSFLYMQVAPEVPGSLPGDTKATPLLLRKGQGQLQERNLHQAIRCVVVVKT